MGTRESSVTTAGGARVSTKCAVDSVSIHVQYSSFKECERFGWLRDAVCQSHPLTDPGAQLLEKGMQDGNPSFHELFVTSGGVVVGRGSRKQIGLEHLICLPPKVICTLRKVRSWILVADLVVLRSRKHAHVQKIVPFNFRIPTEEKLLGKDVVKLLSVIGRESLRNVYARSVCQIVGATLRKSEGKCS